MHAAAQFSASVLTCICAAPTRIMPSLLSAFTPAVQPLHVHAPHMEAKRQQGTSWPRVCVQPCL